MDLEESLKNIRNTGLSNREEETVIITDEPKTPGYLCFPSETANEKYNTNGCFGQGYDPDDTLARIKSHGEYLERLCLNNFLPEKIIVAKYTPEGLDGHGRMVDPGSFCSFSDEQIGNREEFIAKLREQEYRWHAATDLVTGEQVLVPAQLLYLDPHLNDEMPIRNERISTGAALGPKGTDMALHSGFMESLERDACIGAYLQKRELRRIGGLTPKIEEMVEYLQRYHLEPNIFDVTTDLGIPSVMVVTLDKTGYGAAVNIGSRSALKYEDAIEGALLESVHCRRAGRLMRHQQFPDELPGVNDITSMDNRFYYWHDTKRIGDLAFWLKSEKSVRLDELPSITFPKALENLASKGYHIYAAEITLPEIGGAGYETLKVIVPELHPLWLDERAKMLHSEHYGSIPDDKTLKPHPLT